jgi:nickel-dependent lactate racemase
MNLYQAVKGMSAAARIVKRGGNIIIAAECSDGMPRHGNFRELLRSRKSPAELLEMIRNFRETIQDQWQVQILAKVLQQARVYLHSSLPDEEVISAHLIPVKEIARLVAQLSEGQEDFRIAVLPEGPQTVPCLQ